MQHCSCWCSQRGKWNAPPFIVYTLNAGYFWPPKGHWDELLQAALEILEQSLLKAPLAQTAAKAAVDDGFEVPLQKGLVFERAYYAQLFGTEDRVEALRAFAEKRPPKFQGR